MKRFLMILFPCVLAIMVIALLLSSGSKEVKASISKTKCSGWNVVFSPSPGTENALNAVAAASANDAWAVGYFQKGANKKTLTEHWDGKAWKVVASPNLAGDSILYGVSAVPRTNMYWAVGESSTVGQALIVYWNGTAWSMVNSPQNGKGYTLQGVAAASANDVWAVGRGSRQKTLVEHWNGAQWSIVASPTNGDLLSVSAIANNDAWAVGENAKAQTLTEHWNGTQWSVIASPNPTTKWAHQLASVTQVAGTNQVWAVGSRIGVPTPFLTEHWNGKKWNLVHVGVSYSGWNVFNGVASADPKNVVAVGWGASIDDGGYPWALIEQWNGSHWNSVFGSESHAYLNAVARVPGSRNFWAVGDSDIYGHLTPHSTYIVYGC